MSSKSFKFAVLAAAVLALPLSLGACDRQGDTPAQPPKGEAAPGASGERTPFNGTLDISSRGSRMPDFALRDPSGKILRNTDLIGRPALINLWATWCGPCVLEMPMLDSLAGEGANGSVGKLRVITVSQDITGAEKVTPFFAKNTYQHLEPWLDPDNQLSIHYATGILPTTILYDKDGREVWRMIGGHDWSGPRTAAMLGETLGS